MMKPPSKLILAVAGVAVLLACFSCHRSRWRTDPPSLAEKIPVLGKAEAYYWKAEILGGGCACPIGPSSVAYQCYIPRASKVLPELLAISDYTEKSSVPPECPAEVVLQPGETPQVSESLDKLILLNKYYGSCYYFRQSDVLYLDIIH